MSGSVKEIISFVGIALLILAMALIQFSRRKLSGWLSIIFSVLAFICLILGAIVVFFVVFSGPTM